MAITLLAAKQKKHGGSVAVASALVSVPLHLDKIADMVPKHDIGGITQQLFSKMIHLLNVVTLIQG